MIPMIPKKDRPHGEVLVYLATPYTHADPRVMERRFLGVNKAAAILMKMGFLVYSPISHTHPIALAGDLPKEWSFWGKFDTVMMSHCNCMIVLMQEGWRESKGIKEEIKIAQKLKIPFEFIKPNEIEEELKKKEEAR